MKHFTLGLIVGITILAIAKADELGITPSPQQLQGAGAYIEGLFERRSRQVEEGSHVLCSGDMNQMNLIQRQRVAWVGTPKWCND